MLWGGMTGPSSERVLSSFAPRIDPGPSPLTCTSVGAMQVLWCCLFSFSSYFHFKLYKANAQTHTHTGVVIHNDLLYVVGGDDGISSLSSVEYYNPKNDSWTLLNSGMNVGRSYAGVCVINRSL